MSRRSHRWWILLVVGVLTAALFVGGATAHAYLSDTDPGDGERIDEVPERVTLSYTGDGIEHATVTVRGPDGESVGGEARIDPDDRQVVTVPIENSGDGTYLVDWEVLADDGHTTTGTVFFVVGEDGLDRDQLLDLYTTDGEDDDISPIEAGSKGLLLLSLVGLIGIPVTLRYALYPVVTRPPRPAAVRLVDDRTRTLLAVAGVLLFVGIVGLGLARSASIGGGYTVDAIGTFLGTSLGRVWIGQLVAAGAMAVVLLAACRYPMARSDPLMVAFAGGLAVGFTVSWTSHSASVVSRLEGVVIDFAHVGGAAFWAGGLVTLALVGPALLERLPETERRTVAARLVRRFSVVAIAGVTLAIASGLILTSWHVPDPESVLTTAYGNVLSTKAALVLLALGLGGFARFVLLRRLREDDGSQQSADGRSQHSADRSQRSADDDRPSSTDRERRKVGTVRRFVRTVRVEVAVVVLVVLLSGLLTSMPTAGMVAVDDGNDIATFEAEVDGVDVEITVLPSVADRDLAVVDEDEPLVIDVVFERDGDRIEADDDVRLLLYNDENDVSMQVDLDRTDDGTYSTVQALPESDRWEVRVDGWVDGTHVSEWVDLYAIPDHPDEARMAGHDHDHGDDGDHDHGDGGDHDHGAHDHDHEGHDHHEHEFDERPGLFEVLLRFIGVMIGIGGTVAVAVEASRVSRFEE